jgi:hypothetical protein
MKMSLRYFLYLSSPFLCLFSSPFFPLGQLQERQPSKKKIGGTTNSQSEKQRRSYLPSASSLLFLSFFSSFSLNEVLRKSFVLTACVRRVFLLRSLVTVCSCLAEKSETLRVHSTAVMLFTTRLSPFPEHLLLFSSILSSLLFFLLLLCSLLSLLFSPFFLFASPLPLCSPC